MASTNKTTNYDLSQYIGTDKPTYLVDYNQDMAKIDAGIHGAKSEADANSTNIGNLEDLTTTTKSNLVGAINEIKSNESDLSTAVENNKDDIDELQEDVGNLINLSTVEKSNLVGAINEVDANSDSNTSKIGNLTNLTTSDKSDLVSSINEVNYNVGNFNLSSFETIDSFTGGGSGEVTVAKNNDGSLAKIYGHVTNPGYPSTGTISFQTSLRPSSDITINGGAIGTTVSSSGIQYVSIGSYTLKTTGVVEFNYGWFNSQTTSGEMIFINSLIFVKDFGDIPIPVNNN